jgi:hypothetical protein
MSGNGSSWSLTAAAMALVVVTALVAGLVVATWTAREARDGDRGPRRGPWLAREHLRPPTAVDVDTCQAHARAESGEQPFAAVADTVALALGKDRFDSVRSPEARYVRAYRACLRERGYTS